MPVVIGVPAETAAGEQSVGLLADVSNKFKLDKVAAPERARTRQLFSRRWRASLQTSASI